MSDTPTGTPAAPPAETAPLLADETAGFGHGKIILLGEHTVVFGHPALAAGLPVGVSARVRPGAGHVRCAEWGLEARMGHESSGDAGDVARALSRLCETLGADGRALDVTLTAGIPARAGLGSSAAMAVAVARAVAARVGAAEQVDALAAATGAAETVFHGTPSGVDAAAATHGGVGLYDKAGGWRPAPVRQPIKLCVGFSGQPRRTADLVAAVAVLAGRSSAARQVIETLASVTRAGGEALAVGDIDNLGRLFDLAHGLLAGLRLSTLPLERLVYGARAAGALGAKLTGAGGGGAVIALAPSHRADVVARWQQDGYASLVTSVGGA